MCKNRCNERGVCCELIPYMLGFIILSCAIIAGICAGSAYHYDFSDPEFTVGIIFAIIGTIALIVGIIISIFFLYDYCLRSRNSTVVNNS